MHPILRSAKASTLPHELALVDQVWGSRQTFIEWPIRSLLFMPGAIRGGDFRSYSPQQLQQIKGAGLRKDPRTNGPAVMAYGIAGGKRPMRSTGKHGWSVHHIYDGNHPAPGHTTTTHAVKDGRYFTESACLVAVHPVADALAAEVPYFAWLLRHEAFVRFGFNPDGVL